MFNLGVNIFFISIQAVVLFFTTYNMLLWLLSLFIKQNYKRHKIDRKHKFSFLVCCHNEEVVIGDIIRSINKMDYPKEMYDIYIICDNCSEDDRSAQISLSLGANVIVRQDKSKIGKGFGIDYALNYLWNLDTFNSDGIIILDADNLVDNQFLNVANKRFNMGQNVIQFKVDTKNVQDSWITKSNALSFWNSSIFYQTVRDKFAFLSAQLSGTGFVVKTDVLKEYGFNCNSLCEDLEFSSLYPMKSGDKIYYTTESYVLDEKPLGLKASSVQVSRWQRGSLSVLNSVSFSLFKSLLTKFNFRVLDNLIYLLQPTKTMLASSLLLFNLLNYFFHLNFIVPYYVWSILFLYFMFQNFYSLIINGHKDKLHWFFIYYIFTMINTFILFTTLIKNKKNVQWNPTKHVRTVSSMTEIIQEDISVELKTNII